MGRDKFAAHFMQKNSGEEQSKGPRRLGQNEVGALTFTGGLSWTAQSLGALLVGPPSITHRTMLKHDPEERGSCSL